MATQTTTTTALPDVNTLLAQYNKTGPLSIDQMLGSTSSPATTITSKNIDPNTPTLKVPPPPPATGSTDLNSAIAGAGTYTPPTTPVNTERTDTMARIKELIGLTSQQSGDAIKIQEDAGVFKKQQALTDIENRIASVNRNYEQQARLIRKNTEGKFGGAVNQDLNVLQRQSDEQNADLSIIKSAASNDLQTALKISEAKINAKYEPLKLELDGLKTFLELNQHDLTDSENLQLQSQIRQKENALNAATDQAKKDQETKTNLLSAAAQQGAPSSVMIAIQGAKTVQEAITAAGKYGGDILARAIQQAQLDEIKRKTAADEGSKLLTVDEAKKLGVPYGTTRTQAAAMTNNTNGGADKAAELQGKITLINDILNAPGLNAIVGPSPLARSAITTAYATGDAQAAAGSIHQLVAKDTIATLLALKAQGGTLGALSNQERIMLQTAATKIGSWEVLDANGVGTGEWNVSEVAFKTELNTIKTLTQKAVTKALGYDPSLFNPDEMNSLNGVFGTASSSNPSSFY